LLFLGGPSPPRHRFRGRFGPFPAATPMLRPLLLCLVVMALAPPGCAPARDAANATDGAESFSFTYETALGRDCYRAGDCGYRLVVSPDGTLRRFDDRGEETASAALTSDEKAELLERLERGGFFDLPERLPDVPPEEMTRGGRVVTMAFEGGSLNHRVEAHPDVQAAPMPEAYYTLEEEVREYLLTRL
jgi:hypothetical protein